MRTQLRSASHHRRSSGRTRVHACGVRTRAHACGVLAVLTAGMTVSLIIAGCNYAAPASYAIFGAGKIDAVHNLDQVRSVVFVDDRQNVLPRTGMRATIGDKVSGDIMTEKLVPSAVRPADAIVLTRQREDGAKPLSIAAIGRQLECQQVIYVQLSGFSLSGDGSLAGAGATPTATAYVKVIDAVNNGRSFPTDDGPGYQVTAKLREVDQDQISTAARRRAVEDKLCMELGLQIGLLFYEHERVNLGEKLGTR